MRVFGTAMAVAGLAILGLTGGPSALASASRSATAATQQVVVSPVTPAGHAAPGFVAKPTPGGPYPVECNYPSPSPAAVDPNIEFCSPSAAYAVACWNAAKPHSVLCMQNPTSHRLVRFRRKGAFAKTAPPAAKDTAPLLLELRNGTKCDIRDGGAWGSSKSHPKWVGTYSCTHGVIWAPENADHAGINESSSTWTVHVGPGNGRGKFHVRAVKLAYFVGTAG